MGQEREGGLPGVSCTIPRVETGGRQNGKIPNELRLLNKLNCMVQFRLIRLFFIKNLADYLDEIAKQ